MRVAQRKCLKVDHHSVVDVLEIFEQCVVNVQPVLERLFAAVTEVPLLFLPAMSWLKMKTKNHVIGTNHSARIVAHGLRKTTTKKVLFAPNQCCRRRVMSMCRGDFSTSTGLDTFQYRRHSAYT